MAEQFRLTGLTRYVDRMLDRLAAAPRDAELRDLHRSLLTTSRRMEISLSLKRLGAAQLTATTRSLRAWVAFLADREGLDGYVAAVRAGTAALDAAVRTQHRWRAPVRLHLRPMRGMYRMRQRPDALEVSLPTPAVSFGPADFAALARDVFAADPAAKRHVLDRMQSEEFAAIAAELGALGGAVDESRGATYDLGEVFDRVNAEYFRGQVARPRLFWSRSLTRRKFGHYDWIGDAVMVSRTLDAAAVPRFVVEFVVYHELLHKVHGIRWSNGRRYAHTADFHRDERRFARFAEAESWISKLARGRPK